MSDRGAHIRVTELREYRTIYILDHGMDDALGMDHDLNFLRCCVKQPMGLNHLQPLVHHGCRIN